MSVLWPHYVSMSGNEQLTVSMTMFTLSLPLTNTRSLFQAFVCYTYSLSSTRRAFQYAAITDLVSSFLYPEPRRTYCEHRIDFVNGDQTRSEHML